MIERLLRHGDDLDFMQSLITSLGNRSELNPSLNAVHTAYTRRRFTGRFKNQSQSIEMDTLLHQDTKGTNDDDKMILQTERQKKTAPGARLCILFQKGNCTFSNCKFPHKCAVCDSYSHGAISCSKKELTHKGVGSSHKTKPPHPRYRRERALSE